MSNTVKNALIAALVVSIGLNLYLAFSLWDSVATGHFNSGAVERAWASEQSAKTLIPALLSDTSRQDVEAAARALNMEIVGEGEDSQCVDAVCFDYEGGKVSGFTMSM